MILLNKQEVSFTTFPNKEKRLDLDKTLIIEDNNSVIWKWTSDEDIFELFLLDNVLNKLKTKYTLSIPYMPYSRMDRVQAENTAFSLDVITTLFAQQLKAVKEIVVLDPHSPKTLDLFTLKGMIAKESPFSLAKHIFKDKNIDTSKIWVVFPDKGASIRYNANDYENVIVCDKVRDFATGKIEGITASILKKENLNEVSNKFFIIDDLCSYGGTFIGCLNAIKKDLSMNIEESTLIVSHTEDSILKGSITNEFTKIYTTDSLATINNVEKIEQVSIKEIL